MEITRVMKGTPQTFFSVLMNALHNDLEQAGICADDLKEGLQYQKQLRNKVGKCGVVQVEVTKLHTPVVYEAAFTSAQGINTLSYCVDCIDDEHMQIMYREDFHSSSLWKRCNYAIMERLYRRSCIKKANQMLDQLQQFMKEIEC